jgi:hypothetical protein
MCGRNIVSEIHYHGGMLVQTTRSIEKTTRTTRQMAEVQRDSYQALAENLAAAQRRSMGLAEDGLEFMRLQEENARAAREWFAGGVKLLQLQQRVRSASKQQEAFGALTRTWAGTYRDFFAPFAYFGEGLRTSQQATRQGLEATEQVARQGLRIAEEATEQTEEVLRQTEKATKEAELKAAVHSALKTPNYDELSVAEISRRLDGLSTEQLRNIREYEKHNKNRETLIEQIDRKIRANS